MDESVLGTLQHQQIGIGTVFEVEFLGDGTRLRLQLVDAEDADVKAGLLSAASPLSRAVRGAHVGAIRSFKVKEEVWVRVVRILA